MRKLALLIGAALAGAAMGVTTSSGARDVLWSIVESCLDPSAVSSYCARCPVPLVGQCPGKTGCRDTTEVWAVTPEYVAIRDSKMCGCPAGFTHGLAMPRAPVTGVEDRRRPDGLWPFAWEVARARMPDDVDIALVVNPPDQRGQDQLHIHIVRLKPDARRALERRQPAKLQRLEDVWTAAGRDAASKGLRAYGILVARDDGGYLMVTDAGNLERQWTVARC